MTLANARQVCSDIIGRHTDPDTARAIESELLSNNIVRLTAVPGELDSDGNLSWVPDPSADEPSVRVDESGLTLSFGGLRVVLDADSAERLAQRLVSASEVVRVSAAVQPDGPLWKVMSELMDDLGSGGIGG